MGKRACRAGTAPLTTNAETDLWHEPETGRLHRRVRRRPRLECAERRAVPVVVRPGGGDGPGAVRAQTVGDDELPLADRRPAAWRHTGADRVRPPRSEEHTSELQSPSY